MIYCYLACPVTQAEADYAIERGLKIVRYEDPEIEAAFP